MFFKKKKKSSKTLFSRFCVGGGGLYPFVPLMSFYEDKVSCYTFFLWVKITKNVQIRKKSKEISKSDVFSKNRSNDLLSKK